LLVCLRARTISSSRRSPLGPRPPGTFSASAGSAICTSCDTIGDGYTSGGGSTSCALCRAGYYRRPVKDTCVACPPNARCQESVGDLLPAPATGFWLDTSSAKEFEVLVLFQCARLTCAGGNPSSDTSSANSESCWSADEIADCDPNALLCSPGASGPLCGSCLEGFVYDSSGRVCQRCGVGVAHALGTVSALVFIAVICFASQSASKKVAAWFTLPPVMDKWFVVGVMRKIDSGMLRVMLSNYQIINSVSASLDVSLPYSFANMLSFLNVLSLDLKGLQCATQSYFGFVFAW
jgi:hypothetical protein